VVHLESGDPKARSSSSISLPGEMTEGAEKKAETCETQIELIVGHKTLNTLQ